MPASRFRRGRLSASPVGIARGRMARERPEHTLQATALVNEALLRLGVGHDKDWGSRTRFLRAAVESMRRILIDHGSSG